MNRKQPVANVEELPPGERKIISLADTEIGVINLDGEYFALENACAHRGGPVCVGKIHGAIEAEFLAPGKRVEEKVSETPAIACPWHGWEYDVRTGEHLGDCDIQLNTYETTVEEGVIYVRI